MYERNARNGSTALALEHATGASMASSSVSTTAPAGRPLNSKLDAVEQGQFNPLT